MTGVSDVPSTDECPFPKPKFRPGKIGSSALEFEVSIFESNLVDFIVPENLFSWRLGKIEKIICDGGKTGIHDKNFLQYFTPEEGDEGYQNEDALLVSHKCKMLAYNDIITPEIDPHFRNSGYEAIRVKWENDEAQLSCPWELHSLDCKDKAPLPPCLTELQKESCFKILDNIEEDSYVRSNFLLPVNIEKFVDYLSMVEVPMDLSFIRTRLQSDYYTNVLSFKADFKLLFDNCIKYNEHDTQFGIEALKLQDVFKKLFDSVMKAIPQVPGIRINSQNWPNDKDISSHLSDNFKKKLPNEYNQSTPLNSSNLLIRSGQNFQGSIDSDEESKIPILQSRKRKETRQAVSGKSIISKNDTSNDNTIKNSDEKNYVRNVDILRSNPTHIRHSTRIADKANILHDHASSNENEYESDIKDSMLLNTLISENNECERTTRSSRLRSSKNKIDVNHYESSEAEENEYIEEDSIGSNCDSVQECVSISSNESQESECSNDSENCMLGNRQKNIRVKNRRINNHADSNASKRTTRSSNLTMSTNNISVNKYESSVSDSESNVSHSAKVSNHNEERRSTRIQLSAKNHHKQHEDYNQPIKSNFRSERKRKRSQRYLTQENSQFASNSEESNSDSDFMEKKTSTKSRRSTRKLAKLSSDSEDMWDQENEIEGSSDSSDESCQIVKQQRKSVSNQNSEFQNFFSNFLL